jgi:DNA-directed RNA polymerase beta subunit
VAVRLREFDDIDATREAIFDRVHGAVQKKFPVENDRYRLEVVGLKWDRDKPFTLEDQKKALLSRGNLTRNLKGKWRLVDKETDEVVDEKDGIIAHVPYMTNRGTFISAGNEYTIANQMRLRPAVYTRRKENQELEAHFNTIPGTGKAFRLYMDPESGVFKMKVGQSNLPLYTVLKSLGVPDKDMEARWGKDLLNANRGARQDPQTIKKLYTKLIGRDAPPEQQAGEISAAFERMRMDPYVVNRNLGAWLTPGEKQAAAGDHGVTPDIMLATTRKLMDIQEGKAESDDRDSLANQTFHTPEDFFEERILKDAGGVVRNLLWKSTHKGKLSGVHSGTLTPQVKSVITSSGMAQPIEEINPVEVADQMFRVLRLGEGGIPCYSDDTEVLTECGWKLWVDVSSEDRLACMVDGSLQFHNPHKLYCEWYEGEMYGGRTHRLDYLVTPDHRHWVSTPGTKNKKAVHKPYEFRLAKDVHRKKARHLIRVDAYDAGISHVTYTLPPAPVVGENRGSATDQVRVFDSLDWFTFVGIYLAEGSVTWSSERREYRTFIAKRKSANPKEWKIIDKLLKRMGLSYRYGVDEFVIYGKEIAWYFKQFGTATRKSVPEYVMSADLQHREAFLSGILFDSTKTKRRDTRYASASAALRDGVARLAVMSGYGVTYYTREKVGENPQYQVLIQSREHATICLQKSKDQYYTAEYAGYVYCASVPGELLFVRRNGKTMWSGNSRDAIPDEARGVQPSQFGFIDPIRGPESEALGVDTRLAFDTYKGDDGHLYSNFRDPRTGKIVPVSAQAAADMVLAFPGEMDRDEKKVRAMARGRLEYVDRSEVDYELPHISKMLNASVNLVPMSTATQGNRLLMAGKMFNQALALRNPEAPLVQSATEVPDVSFESLMGRKVGAAFAKKPGTVKQVRDNKIIVANDDGTKEEYEMYNNFPLNRKSYIQNTPVVKAGDKVSPNQMLARSNFTDEKGDLALGTNLRVAFIPYKGLTYEDAYVISESAAKKMSSEHMYTPGLELEKDVEPGYNKYVSHFPSKYDKDQLGTIDEEGTVKPGTVVKKGDPLILAVGKVPRKAAGQWTQIARRAEKSTRDRSVEWDHDFEGVVTDVVEGKDGVQVAVRAYVPMKTGDKLSGRFGDKGTIARIIPDEQMPKNAEGKPFEVIQNPATLPSRMNPAQIFEMALSKIARKTGKPVKMSSSMEGSYVDYVEEQLKKHGLSDTEDIEDPEMPARRIKDVLTGDKFFMKLHHTAESKWGARDTGGYTAEGLPAGGGKEGSKTIASLGMNALLSHGAVEVLRDTKINRGQKNEDFWRSFKLGYPPPSPKIPLVYKKFVNYLKGSGINLQKDGDRLNIMAMTDKDVDALSGGEIRSHETVNAKDLQPVEGGLFDRGLTGGHGGNKWSHIKLSDPLPNPVMEEPIRRLLGLTQKEYEAVLSGDKELHGRTGGHAIKEALARLKVDESIDAAKVEVKERTGAGRDAAVKRLRYLSMLKDTGMRPEEFVISKVPVVPPNFRPISKLKGNMQVSSDANYLYQDLLFNDEAYRGVKKELGADQAGQERLNTYKALKAVTGLGDPVHPKLKEKGVAGMLKHVFGKNSPKFGMFQRRVVGSKIDVAGRSVITPNPSLDMDQVGLPEDQAWKSYSPFVVRSLVQQGMNATQAAKLVEERDPRARDILMSEMEKRPIIVSRAPTLHKYGMMAAFPKLIKGHTLQVPPIVTPGFGADFDGDSCSMATRIVVRVGGLVVSMTASEFVEDVLGGHDQESGKIWYPEGIEVPTADGWAPMKSFSVHAYDKPLYEVELNNGSRVRVTGDHSLMVGGEEIKPTDVKAGDTLDHTELPEVSRAETHFGWKRGYLDGYFVGDGSSDGRRVSFACKDDELRNQLASLVREVVGWHVFESKKHGYLTVSSSSWAGELMSLFGRYSDAKAISDLIFNLDEDYLWGFVFGYIDSDGSVERTRSGSYLVRVWSISEELMQDYSFILYSLGIPHSFRYRNRGSKSDAWVVSIGKDGVKMLAERAPHRGHKVDKLRAAVCEYKSRKTKKRSLQESGYKVKSVTEVPNEPWVFDIEADGTFMVGNGIVVHNTMSYTVPVSDKAVNEAIDKMLPSRNLKAVQDFDVHYYPQHEYQMGLYQASTKKSKKGPVRFRSVKDALAAYKRGDIDVGDEVVIS